MTVRNLGASWLFVGLIGLALPSFADGEDTPLKEQLSGLHLLQGPWDPGIVHRESVLFLKGKTGNPTARLVFDAEKVISVDRADGTKTFKLGHDYQVNSDGSGLELLGGSSIPFLNETDLFRPKGSPMSIGQVAGKPEMSVLFDNGHYFHDMQVEVTYVPKQPKWSAYRPAFAGERLKRTIGRLKQKQPVTLVISGDSISEGYNASRFTKTTPFLPPYSNLVAAQLEQTYGSTVKLHNLAIAGWSSSQGVKDIENVIKRNPNLVVIAYGMNDVGRRNPEAFKKDIKAMIDRIQKANASTDIILVATMTGNPDWYATPAEMFPKYRDALASLEGEGVVLVDLTSIWLRLLERKRHVDLTGNGVNHPNDYGHRVYAQAILALLVDPALIARPTKP